MYSTSPHLSKQCHTMLLNTTTYLSDKLEICRGEDAYDGVELDPLDQAFEAHFAQNESANQQEINAILERERHVPWDMMAVNHVQGALARPLTRTWS